MNVQPLKSLVQSATKVRPLGCANLVSKPAITRTLEGEFKLATELIGDTCHFSHVDRSLEPNFLKGLLKIEGKDPLDTAKLIKDELLKAMGFKNPEALKLVHTKSENYCCFVPMFGKIALNETAHPKEEMIALLRHELEHMSQFVKIYKAKGKTAFAEAILKSKKFENPNLDATVEDVLIWLEKDFYETMAKDVSIEGFDAEKYYKAMSEYVSIGNSLESRFKYFNNLLEKDAYAVQKKVLAALGQDCTVAPDGFPNNYTEIIKLLTDKGIPKEQHEYLLQDLIFLAEAKNYETPENTKKLMKLCNDMLSGIDVSKEDKTWTADILDKLAQSVMSDKQNIQPYFQQVEAWLREGKYTVEDVLKDM